jgi:hypothetical protein
MDISLPSLRVRCLCLAIPALFDVLELTGALELVTCGRGPFEIAQHQVRKLYTTSEASNKNVATNIFFIDFLSDEANEESEIIKREHKELFF